MTWAGRQANGDFIDLTLTEAEASSLASFCRAVMGSGVNSRKVHAARLLRSLEAIGVPKVPETEFTGRILFRFNKQFDHPILPPNPTKKEV